MWEGPALFNVTTSPANALVSFARPQAAVEEEEEEEEVVVERPRSASPIGLFGFGAKPVGVVMPALFGSST